MAIFIKTMVDAAEWVDLPLFRMGVQREDQSARRSGAKKGHARVRQADANGGLREDGRSPEH